MQQVGAVKDSPEYRFAVRKNAKVNPGVQNDLCYEVVNFRKLSACYYIFGLLLRNKYLIIKSFEPVMLYFKILKLL
mgnify:CR=1 FL=1